MTRTHAVGWGGVWRGGRHSGPEEVPRGWASQRCAMRGLGGRKQWNGLRSGAAAWAAGLRQCPPAVSRAATRLGGPHAWHMTCQAYGTSCAWHVLYVPYVPYVLYVVHDPNANRPWAGAPGPENRATTPAGTWAAISSSASGWNRWPAAGVASGRLPVPGGGPPRPQLQSDGADPAYPTVMRKRRKRRMAMANRGCSGQSPVLTLRDPGRVSPLVQFFLPFFTQCPNGRGKRHRKLRCAHFFLKKNMAKMHQKFCISPCHVLGPGPPHLGLKGVNLVSRGGPPTHQQGT